VRREHAALELRQLVVEQKRHLLADALARK
jgi:hypothetical protein